MHRRFFSCSLALVLSAASGVSTGLAMASDAAETTRQTGTQGVDACGVDHGLPFIDARLRDDGFPKRSVAGAVNRARALPANHEREVSLAKMIASVPGAAADEDGLFGTPRFVRSTEAVLTGPSKLDALEIVRGYVGEYAAAFEIAPKEIADARVSRDYRTLHNGARHMTFQQTHAGLDLFQCEVRANLTGAGELINISSTMLPRPEAGFAVPEAKIEDFAAIVAAAEACGVHLSQLPIPASGQEGPSLKRAWEAHPDLRPDESVVTSMILFPLDRETVRPAWQVVVPVKGLGHTYDVIVDAVDGTILWRHNRLVFATTQPITFRVYTSDSPAPGSPGTATPSGFQFPFVPRSLVTVTPEQMAPFSPNGWIDDGGMETIGNNVAGHSDVDNNNQADLPRPNGGAARVFDFALDPAQEPATYRNAAITQLFYWANLYHDKLYALGFDEAAGNFQQINFTGQGVGGDRIQADAQDDSVVSAGNPFTSANNANFTTNGTDGSSGRVQMYLFNGPAPDRDGSLDGDIVFHELTHGTSIRLHGGLAGGNGTQPPGMGEGWSDFVGIALLAEATDDPNGVYCTGGYATHQFDGLAYSNNYYFGIRRFPYSTDLNKNPLTFADIDNAQFGFNASIPRGPLGSSTANVVHNVGEVWCMMLMECRAALWATHGFAANQIMLQLVIDGMKISPGNPTFVQARDSILQADLVNNGGANQLALWTAFAKRGIGGNAVAPISSSTAGVIESYVVPRRANFEYPDGRPGAIAPGVASAFRVKITGTLLSIIPGTAVAKVSVDGGAAVSAPLASTGTPDEYLVVLPALSCFSRVAYWIETGTSEGVRTDPATAPAAMHRAIVATGQNPLLSDSFETDSGWTVGPSTASSGLWVRADPVGTEAQPEDAHSGAGTLCWVTGNAAPGAASGAADVDSGQTTLLSPAFDLSAQQDAIVSYWRWYSNGTGSGPYADTFRVDVSVNNGSSWTNAETVGPGGGGDPDTNPGWRFASWRLSSLGLSPTAQVRVRFIAEDIGTGSIVEAAVDDFAIAGATCEEPAATVTCCRGTTCAAGVDAAACVSGVGMNAITIAGSCTGGSFAGCCFADFDKSGTTTIDDIFQYLNAWFAGSPFADVGGNGAPTNVPTIDDIFQFLDAWFAGCV